MTQTPQAQSAAGDPASPLTGVLGRAGGEWADDPRLESAHSPLPPAAELYAESFGWPVNAEGDEVTVTCGDLLDVTTMPAGFAGEVNQLLRLHLLRAPIMEMRAAATDESSTWAFFSQPRQPFRSNDQLLKLSSCKVKHFGVGTTFQLPPSPTCGSDTLDWRVPPPFGALKNPLPPWESIASCALKVMYRAIGR